MYKIRLQQFFLCICKLFKLYVHVISNDVNRNKVLMYRKRSDRDKLFRSDRIRIHNTASHSEYFFSLCNLPVQNHVRWWMKRNKTTAKKSSFSLCNLSVQYHVRWRWSGNRTTAKNKAWASSILFLYISDPRHVRYWTWLKMDISSLCLSKLHIFPSFLQVANCVSFQKKIS